MSLSIFSDTEIDLESKEKMMRASLHVTGVKSIGRRKNKVNGGP